MEKKITVLLVDDHSLVRRGFRRLLEDEPDMEVVGEAGDGEESIRLAKELHPRVVVMDCALPGMNGLQATRKIVEDSPQTSVLMLSMHVGSSGRRSWSQGLRSQRRIGSRTRRGYPQDCRRRNRVRPEDCATLCS
jgi:DNA-binding NarL/FixJ family response regulator